MARHIELLLLENVENLGIVGDLVRVKVGYARNYLLPMQKAEFPTEEKVEALKEARAAAQAEFERVRKDREATLSRLEGIELTLVRSANDQGALYGSVTQRDIADALAEAHYFVEPRAIRLKSAIKRTGSFDVPIQFDKELRTDITLIIESDRPIEELEEPEVVEDDEGEAAPTAETPAPAER